METGDTGRHHREGPEIGVRVICGQEGCERRKVVPRAAIQGAVLLEGQAVVTAVSVPADGCERPDCAEQLCSGVVADRPGLEWLALNIPAARTAGEAE